MNIDRSTVERKTVNLSELNYKKIKRLKKVLIGFLKYDMTFVLPTKDAVNHEISKRVTKEYQKKQKKIRVENSRLMRTKNASSQATPEELFDLWWTGNRQIPELAKTYGYCPSSLSHKFTRMIGRRKKELTLNGKG